LFPKALNAGRSWTTRSGFIDHNPLENWWPAFRCRSIYSISNLLSSTEVSISKGCATVPAPARPEAFPTKKAAAMAANSNMHNLATLIKRCVSYLLQYFPTSGIQRQAKDSARGFVQEASHTSVATVLRLPFCQYAESEDSHHSASR
jgi:hypothetical protein